MPDDPITDDMLDEAAAQVDAEQNAISDLVDIATAIGLKVQGLTHAQLFEYGCSVLVATRIDTLTRAVRRFPGATGPTGPAGLTGVTEPSGVATLLETLVAPQIAHVKACLKVVEAEEVDDAYPKLEVAKLELADVVLGILGIGDGRSQEGEDRV